MSHEFFLLKMISIPKFLTLPITLLELLAINYLVDISEKNINTLNLSFQGKDDILKQKGKFMKLKDHLRTFKILLSLC